jgi:triosephosphate isomerase
VSSARTPLVAGNWKMHTTVAEGVALANAIAQRERPQGVEVALLPPFTHLWPVHQVLRGSGLRLGAQNAFWEDAGAYTGEVSPAALSGWCDYVLLGHSERRHLFGETDEQVARKLRRVLSHEDLRAIVAVGETLGEREAGSTEEVVARQLQAALNGLGGEELARCVLAYEPVWAIGTGRTATADQAEDVCRFLRDRVAGLAGAGAAAALRILYGGSVTAENAASLFAEPDIDGGLVGGASLRADDFAAIVAAGVPG